MTADGGTATHSGGDGAENSAGVPLETTGPFDLVPAPVLRPPSIGIALLTASYLAVFLSITDIVGGSGRLLFAVTLAMVGGIVLARILAVRGALLLTGVLFGAGVVTYYLTIPQSYRELVSVSTVFFDTISMLTGLSVLRLLALDVWVVAVAPIPTFLAWFLAARGRYVQGAVVGGVMLSFFVLTGDAGTSTTLLGVIGVALAAGLDTLSVPNGIETHWDTLVVLVAAMMVLSVTLAVVPGGAAQPWISDRGNPGLESSLAGSQDSLQIVGPVDLSPEVRFTVQSTQGGNWHTASYDRYTGDGWVRTGEPDTYTGELESPPGTTVQVEQTVTAETTMDAFPAQWQAVRLDGPAARNAQVTAQGGIQPGAPIREGESVTVHSEVVQAPPDALREAPTEYPEEIETQYTQLPDSTPDRVGALTGEVIESADADNPYDQAVAVERYLQQSKDYSLSVQRPEGDVADAFLFEMEAGYCTYFATAMVAMLRSQGVPATFVTGYSEGERVGQDEWVVRGQNAHAWVKVYIPEHGWVEFDPTPSAERDEVREQSLEQAREENVDGVDLDDVDHDWAGDDGSETDEVEGAQDEFAEGDLEAYAPDEGELEGLEDIDPADPEVQDPAGVGDVDAGAYADDGTDDGSALPSQETIGYALLALLGIVAGVHHTGAATRVYRAGWVRVQRRHTPKTDADVAFARLEYLLGRQYRERRSDETPREYVAAMLARGADDRIQRVGEVYERALFADDVTEAEADEAVRTVTRLALEATPVVGRFLR